MHAYALRRLLLLMPILLGITLVTFFLFRLVPADPAERILGWGATPESVAALRHELGLDKSLVTQYLEWVGGVFKGDLGTSYYSHVPLTDELRHRLPVTLELLIMTMIISLALGIPSGIVSAIRPNTPIDYLARFASVLGLSIPGFWLATLFIVLPVIWFDWAPPFGYVPFFDNPGTNLQQFIFPALALGLALAAGIMRLTRSSLLEVMRNDYIRTAWSKGLREATVVRRHAMKNAMIPVLTILGLQVAALLGGSIVMEYIFALPGMGRLILTSILNRDYGYVQGLVLLAAVVFVVANLVVDLAYAWLDPRIRYR